MNVLFKLLGLLALAVGLLWVGQGLGYVKWPTSSFMISQIQWVYYGFGVAAVGVLILGIAFFKK